MRAPILHPGDPLRRTGRRQRTPGGASLLLGALVVSVVASLVPAAPARAQSALGFLELEERLVERQLEVELADYRRARSREQQAHERASDAADGLDRALSEGGSAARVAELAAAVDAARAQERAAVTAVDDLVERIVTRRLRLELLREELRRRRGGPADLPDPITGTWRLSLAGSGPEREAERGGLLDLELRGTEVRGTLGVEDGTFGSVRGTFIRGRLELERVSADEGLDLILEGTYDPEEGVLEGTWRPAVAGLGNPGGGTWRAAPAEPTRNE